MKIILLGPPGAGKGTQAQVVSRHLSVPQISTGDMLREAVACGSALGRQLQTTLDSGALVPDPLMLSIIQERIDNDDCRNGFLLDGFPRTRTQAEGLAELGITIDWVIELQVDSAVLIRRLSGRRVHPGSGRTYHIEHNPPKREGLDDLTGEPLVQRADDRVETVSHRLAVYNSETAPLVAFYVQRAGEAGAQGLRLLRLDGAQSPQQVTSEILSALANGRKS